MNLKRFWKEAKQVLAFVLAIALFFNGWATYDFSVLAAEGDLNVTLNASDAVYTGGDLDPGIYSVTYNGADVAYTDENVTWTDANGQTVDEIKNVGVYTVTVTVTEDVTDADGNVTGTETHSGSDQFTVNVLDISACTVNVNGSYTYTGTAIEPTDITVTGVDKALYTIAEYANNINASNAATVKVKAADGNQNVTGEATGTFTISPKSLNDSDVTVTLANDGKGIVNGTNQEAAVSVNVTVNGATLDAANYSVVKPADITDAGTYDIVVSGNGNYGGSVTVAYVLSYGTEGAVVYSGNTFAGNVYTGTVTISSADGEYNVSESPKNFVDSLTYDENSVVPSKLYLQKPALGSNINEVDFPISGLTFDNVLPTLNVTAPADGWASSKEIVVDADGTGSTCHVYYTKDTKVELTSPINADTDISALTPLSGNLTFERNISTPESYYFYAIDDAGNVVISDAVVVNKVDVDTPEISIDPDNEVKTYYEGVFWKSAANLVVPYQVTDDLSGVKSVSIVPSMTFSSVGTTKVNGSFTITEAGTYTVSATDEAGLPAEEKSFVVKVDTKAPEVALSEPNGTNKYSINDVDWFSDKNVKISLKVTDELGSTANEELSPYTVVYSTDPNFASATEVNVTDGEGTAAIEIETAGTAVTYYFKVVDIAGNEGTVQSVQLAYDDTPAEITKVELTQLDGDEWINDAEKITDNDSQKGSKVEFSVTAEDSQTGIKRIEYTADDWNTVGVASYTEANGTYTFVTNEVYPDGENYQWKVRVVNNVEVTSDPTAVVGGKIDTTAPDTTAYIRFLTDTIGANDQTNGTASKKENTWASNILKMASDTWNKIWGKQTVTFEVYVQDVTSGIADITMSYKDKKIQDANLSVVTGLKAFTEGDASAADTDSKANGYTVYKGYITYTGDEGLAVKDFQIDSITDVAGNTVNGPIILGNAADTDIIYIDAVAPEFNIQIKDDEGNITDNVDEKEKYYLEETQTVVLSIEERFFAQENTPMMPEVQISKRSDAGAAFEVDPDLTSAVWTQISDNLWQLERKLAEADVEMEYKVTMEAYKDPSGNTLIGKDGAKITGVASDGSFESKIFVIDNVPPVLVDYSVSEPTACTVNGIPVYKNNVDGDDITIEFTIDDNATYYVPENLKVCVYKVGEDEPVKEISGENLSPEIDDRNHSYSFTFDGTDTAEDEFYVTISYEDIAGNKLVGNKTGETSCIDGLYTSSHFILDHVATVFDVEYSDATNVVNDENGKNASDTKPLSDHTAYYNEDIEVTLTFKEKYYNTKNNVLEHFEIVITKDDTELTSETDVKIPDIKWEHDGTEHTATFTIAAKNDHTTDGDYQFVVKYRDCAYNAMTANTDNKDLANLMSTEDDDTVGVYTSPVLVIDTTAPEVVAEYTSDITQTYDGVDYFNGHTGFNITVTDRNIRYDELYKGLVQFSATDSSGGNVSNTALAEKIESYGQYTVSRCNGETDNKTLKVELALTKDANYSIPVAFTDLAGNKANITVKAPEQTYLAEDYPDGYTEKVTIDTEEPEFVSLTYSITDPANYLKWGYLFAQKQITVTAKVQDKTAGIRYIKFIIRNENEKIIKEDTKEIKTPSTSGEYKVSIPLKTNDFKGSIVVQVFDYATNENELTRGHIIESSSKHSATGKAEITTITSPSRTVGGEAFYNTDVKFNLLLEDTYSGIAKWEYTGGHTLEAKADYKSDAGVDLSEDGLTFGAKAKAEIEHVLDRTLTLDAKANNENDILVKATYTDNAGHELSVEEEYNIDVTKPIITVEYDLNNPANGRYYKETRTATVKIRERNFDPADVQFLITSTDGPKPQISSWTQSGSGDDTIHTCTVTYSQDSDYTFTVKFMDMAGNVADYDRVDEFTIDKTKPVATITYDNNDYLNEYYYDASRTATIDILEHNFDPSAIEIMVTADGSTVGVPHISAWASNGDHNIATITFSADAEYTFDIAGFDLALNELDDYEMDHFVVDTTAPELEIFDIEHLSANNGVVRPGIRYYDTNYDQDGTVILMTGYNNGVVEMTGDRKLEANGLELKLDDFAYVQSMDDIYTMEAAVYDLAGNSSEASVMFSVNRFGSVYTFDEATEALVGKNGRYYTDKEQDLVITETNVDTLEFKEITCNLNGKLVTLEEGKDYTVSASGNEATWKQYTYKVKAENFTEEGTYILTIYSEDRATNTSDNSSKGKAIEFVVDKTSPSILISGVKNNGQYRTNSREMTIDIEDNVKLSQVIVSIDGVETVYDAAQINEVDGKFVMNIGSANHWQDIEVTVIDAAGNTADSEQLRVLVTANIFIQFFMNKPIFYGTLGGVAVLAALLWWFLIGKKKKEDEEKQAQKKM